MTDPRGRQPEALRAIAEAASPGRWYVEEGFAGSAYDFLGEPKPVIYSRHPDGTHPGIAPVVWRDTDAAHIAAWSPDRAVAALDVIEAARLCTSARDISEDDGDALRAALDRWEALK